jgi:Holliday junction resolvase RusA-like endonuclease
MQLTVFGTPAPQGSKKYVGNGIMIEASRFVAPWRQAVKYTCYKEHGKIAPLTGAIRIYVTFTLKKPTSAPKKRQTWPNKMPDLDKLLRSTLDGLTEAGVWIDDGQVVEIISAKRYPNEGQNALHIPGAFIEIEEISGDPKPTLKKPEKIELQF